MTSLRHSPLRPLFLIFAATATAAALAAQPVPEKQMNTEWGDQTGRLKTAEAGRGQRFSEGNYAMFIHWGLYSHLGGRWKGQTYYGIGEWIKHTAKIPADDYRTIAADFNPTGFDANAIAQLAADAGMKYVVITSKHHEGFAMFDSKVDAFNIVAATPFRRDPMKELADACRARGLGFGFYYSHVKDWIAPGGSGGPKTDEAGDPVSFDDYFTRKCVPQVTEIVSNYGPLDVVWFDTPGDLRQDQVETLYRLVREKQPGALVNSRIGKGLGDYASKGDMEVPLANIEGLWETVDTTNDSWSYAWYDQNWKDGKEILTRLIATVARGGTYMLNVGPDAAGKIPEPAQRFLREAGAWIRQHPQVVYGASASPWQRALPWGDVTTQGNMLLLSVFDWPRDGKLHLPGLQTEIESATLLGSSLARVTLQRTTDWTSLTLPVAPSDTLIPVIALKLKGPAKVDPTSGIHPNIGVTLSTLFAEVHGAEKQNISWMEKFGEWKHADQVSKWGADAQVTWTVTVQKPGFYRVSLDYKGEKRLVWCLETDEGHRLHNQQAATEKYATYPLGVLEFKRPGLHTLTATLVDGARETASLRSISITPVE